MGENAKRQLVQATRSRPLDRSSYQCCSHSTTTPVGRDHHPDFAETHPARIDANLSDDDAFGNRDHRGIDCPARRQPLNVDRRLGRDAVTFLCHCGQQ